jgi:putative ABC transport system permease protein
MGADLVVVPRSTLVNITSSLLTVQPTEETLVADLAQQIAGMPGIARVAPQRIVPALVEGHPINLIAFDPAHDFSVMPWLEEHQPGPVEGLIAGGRLAARLEATLSVCGMPLSIYGRLGRTGVGPFDESYFLSFDTLADIVSFCRASGTAGRSSAQAQDGQAPPVADMNHGVACSPDLLLDRVSAFLLQLSPAAKLEQVKFSLAQLAGIKMVEGNTVLTSSRLALSTLLVGIAVFTALQLSALLILVALLFSAIVQERSREVGLLRAMGGQAQSGDDDHSRRGGHHHRPRRPCRSRLRRGCAADVRPLAWLLLQPARRPVLLAATPGTAGQRDSGDRVLGHSWSRRRLAAGMAGARNGALCTHSLGRAVT